MIKMVIFDLDGTLLNTLDDLADAGNYVLSLQGFPIHDVEKYKYFIGNGIPKLIERILPEGSSEAVQKTTLNIFNSYYAEHMNDKTKPYTGAVELLEKLNSNNIIAAVVTNKSHEFATSIIEKYFGNLIVRTYGSKAAHPRKPDPYLVNKALSDFGIEQANVLFVGDSGVDMLTAKNAGVLSCGVTWGFRTEVELINNGAKFICNSFDEIFEVIGNLC